MATILGVGFNIPSEDDSDYCSLKTEHSLSDIDILVIRPDVLGSFYTDSKREGLPAYDISSSKRIYTAFEHWRSEIMRFLKVGKTAFVLLPSIQNFFLKEGLSYQQFSNFSILPLDKFAFRASLNNKLVSHNIVKELDKVCSQYMASKVEILHNGKYGTPVFTTKAKDKVLGLHLQADGGNLFMIPDVDELEPTEFDNDDNPLFNDNQITWGHQFKNALIQIHRALKTDASKTPPPTWAQVQAYVLEKSEKASHLIREKKLLIAESLQAISQFETEIEESENLKELLYGTGKPLEAAVIRALHILGYTAENYSDGSLELDQVIISPEGERLIGECEGKDNTHIDIAKFRQLHDSLNEDFEREEVAEKAHGLLFGNAARLQAPLERTVDFTDKCKRAAEREKIGLVRTSDLFFVARYLSEQDDAEYQEKCRKAIKEQLGSVIEFPSIPKLPTMPHVADVSQSQH